MALAANAMTTLETVKEYLRILETDTTHNNSLERMINAVSEFIEKECGRRFGIASYVEKHAGNGRPKLLLNQYPIIAVAAVTASGSPVEPEEFEVISDQGALIRTGFWPWEGHRIGLVGEPAGAKRNIEVQYTAGYVLPKDETPDDPRSLPYDLEDACIEIVAIRHEMRGSEHLKRETIGPLTSEFVQGLPEHILAVLAKYKRWD